ncbi:inverse autotransporter beta domain-containing protein [Martelella alba]|uniref:Big-1 domain-containing protein n=1 Tax=Martelella alba TaxID=2590451 RepID=A0ABY2SHY9_9HYPH|nr:inverse autotransporter beta domain-containing protein [Martelella alba]TKI04986.1 hypothetical protein FCN80_15765 [Martelella alba]
MSGNTHSKAHRNRDGFPRAGTSRRHHRGTALALLTAQIAMILTPFVPTAVAAPGQAAAGMAPGKQALTGGDAAPMARSAAAGAAGNAGEQWLSQFGTAQVQLNLDENFSLKDSAADVLVPLYDTPTSTVFSQLGVRNKDDRNTANLGVGVRTQRGNWLYGVNTFYDYDMTGNHHRMGVGAEAWTDYLKLSTNGYFGLSNWRQSRDFADYKERPANGFDLRAEAWLPTHPQLGGKLMYEQYLGDSVALFGKDNRQKDPYALTANINYTPIPLLTVGAEHRAGKGGINDSAINFQLNYRLGESFRSHLDPSKVAASRQLANSRYDLVSRNNHIVLDYQQQASIRLTLPATLSGAGGETLMVTANVSAQNGLDRVEWDAAALIAAGGAVSQSSTQSLAVTLPPHSGIAGTDTYTLRAVAYDGKGNASNRASTVVSVTGAETGNTAVAISSLVVENSPAPADGKTPVQVRAKVQDAAGNPIAGADVAFSANNGAVLSRMEAKTDEQGWAETSLTQTTAGTTSVTARTGDSTRNVNAEFTDVAASQANTRIEITTSGDKTANSVDAHRVKVTVRDAENNAIAGRTVSFSASGGAQVTPGEGKTDADGTLVADITSTKAGETRVIALVDGFEKNSDAMGFIAGPADSGATTTQLLVNEPVPSGGSNALTVFVRDKYDNPIKGQTVSFSTENTISISPAQGTTADDGSVSATLRGVEGIEQRVSVKVDVGTFTKSVDNILFCDDASWCTR